MLRANRKLLATCLVVTSAWVAGAQAQDPPATAPPQLAEDVDAPFLLEPRTPEEMFAATIKILDQARPRMARRYLEKFAATNPDDQLLLKLRNQHGIIQFLRMAQTEELKPLSTNLLQQVTDAFQRQNADPAYVDGLINGLAGTPGERERALFALRSGGVVVVPRLMQRISQSDDAAELDRLTYTLTQLGRPVVAPVRAGVQADSESVRVAAINSLGFLGDEDDLAVLWYPAFGKDQPDGVRSAARVAIGRIRKVKDPGSITSHGVGTELLRLARVYFREQVEWDLTSEGKVSLWTWDAALRTVTEQLVSPETASLFMAARFARQALAVAPTSPEAQSLLLASLLADSARRSGISSQIATGPGTVHDLALVSGPDAVSRALSVSLKSGNRLAMRGCLQVLSQLASRRQLQFRDAERGPILAALNAPDGVVQFLAATTVLQLDPDRQFPGSNRIVQILSRTLRAQSEPHCLVVDVDSNRSSQQAALLSAEGFVPILASTGRDAFVTASERGDITLIALHINTIRWPLSQTVANLRADSRTAAIPIVIYGDESMQGRIRGLLTRDPLTEFVAESRTQAYLRANIGPFLDAIQSRSISVEERNVLQEAAAYWLAHIATAHRTDLFPLVPAQDTLFAAISNDRVARNALTALSAIASNETQQALCDLAVNSGQTSDLRERAAVLLAFHIQRYGLVLNDTRLQNLMTALANSSDPGLSTALASVLGSLKPNRELVTERLQRFPLPNAPYEPPQAAPADDSTP